MTRSERSRLVRKRIYDATYQLVNEKGSSYTIQDVCRRAGVSVGSFYHFYARKEAVANDIYIFFDEHMSSFLSGVSGSCSERISAAVSEAARYSSSLGAAFLRLSMNSIAGSDGDIITDESPLYLHIASCLEEGKQSGEFRFDGDPGYYARLFVTLFRGTLNWWTVHNGSFDICSVLDGYIALIIKAIS